MRLTCILILLLSLNSLFSQPFTNRVSDSLTYELINKFCKDNRLKRIHKIPIRYIYIYDRKSEIDTTKTISGFDIFLDRVKESDSVNNFINHSDYAFLRQQIAFPSIAQLDHKQVDKTRVKNKRTFFPVSYAISVPLFTIDLQTAIISCNYWGMSRTFLYRRNPISKQWERIDMLWQDGS